MFLRSVQGKYPSADTSTHLAKGRLPAVVKAVAGSVRRGTRILDYGCGRLETMLAMWEHFSKQGATYLPYDPFWGWGHTSAMGGSFNTPTFKQLATGPVDIVLCSNVINVIRDEDIRMGVLENIQSVLAPQGGKAFFTVYEGSAADRKKGPRETKPGCWQNFWPRRAYYPEIQSTFSVRPKEIGPVFYVEVGK